MADHQDTGEESADAYGRHEGCFLDCKRAPYRFKDAALSLLPTKFKPDRKASGGLIPEPGLHVGAFPKAVVNLDESLDPIDPEVLRDFCETEQILKHTSPFLSRLALLKDLQLPLELPELRTDPDRDLAQYQQIVHDKRFGDPFAQWLPISPTKDEEDEGLRFPSKASRLHSLLLQELEHERIQVSHEAAALEDEIQESISAEAIAAPFGKFESQSKRLEADQITPPLSPMSEDSHYSAYKPDLKVCTIDLTSEPSSPVMPEVRRLEKSVEDGTIESGPPACEPAFGPIPSSPGFPMYSAGVTVNLRDLKLDVPLTSTKPSMETPLKSNVFKDPGLLISLGSGELGSEDRPLESFFDEAFATTLEAHQKSAELVIEQERFDPVDSVSRITEPIMDFNIENPSWMKHVTSAKNQFSWIQNQQSAQENLALMPLCAVSEGSLKWAPVKPGAGRVFTSEALEPLSDGSKKLLFADPAPELDSGCLVRRMASLRIERLEEEEELEGSSEDEDEAEAEAVPEKQPYIGSSHFKSPSSQNRKHTAEASTPGLGSLVSAAANKRRRAQESADTLGVTLQPTCSNVTTKLLDGFMEMRAAKKPRTTPAVDKETVSKTHLLPTPLSELPEQESTNYPPPPVPEEPEKLDSAPTPEIIIPGEKGCFVISLSLGRSILRHIEALWPQDHLVDRDYTRHTTFVWSSGGVKRTEMLSTLNFDADIALSPAVGVIVTTLLKAKQKPLPKSKDLPQLRDRVLKVSQKYETLYVLVSECNCIGEYTSKLHPSDGAAYADFVHFCISLQASISTCFVPGADQTMAKWILNLMCQYTPHSLSVKLYLNTVESTWEVFFRRAGMNAFAAQVLAGRVLEKGGNEGLARLMGSSQKEIKYTFREILGGTKGLASLSELLCRPWAPTMASVARGG